MSKLRPEAVAAVRLWAEPLFVGAALFWCARETWRAFAHGGWALWLLLPAALILAGWLYVAVQRALLHGRRSAAPQPGDGQIFVEEERIRRVGPFGRAEVSVTALTRVEIAPGPTPGEALWLLSVGQAPPFAAARAEDPTDAIADALAILPGFSLEAARAAMEAKDGVIREIWRR